MRRAVVNVATASYRPQQDRLVAWMAEVDPGCELHIWQDIPPEWPSHQERPYAFKSCALMEAAADGVDLLLWCDAPIVPVRDLGPIWERIERDGYWIANNGWNNYQWTADSAYPFLFPHLPIEKARSLNKLYPHVSASAFGVSTRHQVGRAILDQHCSWSKSGAICGPWKNEPVTPCGPPDVLGHRHDQTILSAIAGHMGLTLTNCPDVFAYWPHQTDDTVLVSDGGMKLKHSDVFAER